MAIIMEEKNLLTPEQVAGILQVNVLTIYSYIRQGKLNAVRLGRNYRIIPRDLTLFIESNRIKKSNTKVADFSDPNRGRNSK